MNLTVDFVVGLRVGMAIGAVFMTLIFAPLFIWIRIQYDKKKEREE